MQNRLHKCPLKPDKELHQRGESDWRVDANSGTIVVKWKDTAVVTLVSSFVGVAPMGQIQRWSREQKAKIPVECPRIVLEYNKNMGGVDLSDMLNSLYRVDHKSHKWYTRIFFYILWSAAVNAWLLYRRHQGQMSEERENSLLPSVPKFSLLEFLVLASDALARSGKLQGGARRRGRPSLETIATVPPPLSAKYKHAPSGMPSTDVRHDMLDHWAVHGERHRCRHCEKGFTRWKCSKCGVYLCLNENSNCCFYFHHK